MYCRCLRLNILSRGDPRQWSKIAILANLPSRGPLLDYLGNSASNLTGEAAYALNRPLMQSGLKKAWRVDTKPSGRFRSSLYRTRVVGFTQYIERRCSSFLSSAALFLSVA